MRRLIGLTLSIALGLTALVAFPAMANGDPPASDCVVNGGANWEVPGWGRVFIQITARLDKHGEPTPTGKVHWRQDRIGDQAAQNTVADVIGPLRNPTVPNKARVIALIKGGVYFNVQVEDFGEPGAGVDKAWVRPLLAAGPPWLTTKPGYGLVTIDNGNMQVECVIPNG